MGIRVAIDRGGTFTDCIGNSGSGKMEDDVVIKLLSEDPDNYKDAPLEGIRRILSHFSGKELSREDRLDTSKIESIRMGTTVATNALLERKGEPVGLIVTKGFKDCLEIGNQSRPKIFDLDIRKPEVLYQRVVEIDERVTLEDYAEDPSRRKTEISEQDSKGGNSDLVLGLSGEVIRILKRPDTKKIRQSLESLYNEGIQSIAVCLLHGYTFVEHELLVGKIASEVGFKHVSLSHKLMPMIKLVSRATSACADAYLTPTIRKYIDGFQDGFAGNVGVAGQDNKDETSQTRCEFMQSDGGLVDVNKFGGLKSILSGPAGGVVGYALTSYDHETKIPIIGFDMGGTSTDVSRYGEGRYEHVFETTTAGVTIQSPQLDINTVAAGGGSRLFFKNGLFVVGPESAGAHPGPACYRKGGPLTVTDANLITGRLLPEFFPKIFGKNEDEGLDIEASRKLFKELTEKINSESQGSSPRKAMTMEEVALGFIKIANETMTRPIRSLTEARGHDTSKHWLATFGGAGGQHAAAIGESLGVKTVLIHRYSSVLSAYGMSLADVVSESQEPCSYTWDSSDKTISGLQKQLGELRTRSHEQLRQQGFKDEQITFDEYLNMRYRGTESALMVVKPEQTKDKEDREPHFADYGKAFVKQHEQEFGFTLDDRDILVDDVRVRGIGRTSDISEETVHKQMESTKFQGVDTKKAHREVAVYFEGGEQQTPVFELPKLETGEKIDGPALIVDNTQTILIPPNSEGFIVKTHVVLKVGENTKAKQVDSDDVDPIMLSTFGHRFMAIAEQMGRALQKTSVSTNVKERLDFSCALFDADGGLVANAPHLPVHLGSMSTCVQKQADMWRGRLKPGDVLVSNHPEFGGTHLPDITCITPAFDDDKIIFYVASRAHHADIGGTLPGSMPPNSSELFQEGARIESEKLVSGGKFEEKRITELLLEMPAEFPGCSGTRCLADNLNDLKAQIAANQKGINLIGGLISDYGFPVVDLYMKSIQANAERNVRELLRNVAKRFEGRALEAVDYMDDGSPIKLKITIDSEKGEAIFDFAGTGPEVYGNINAPKAVTFSAIIYCLRCMITDEIPLNQGCLKPIKVLIPPGSFLDPSNGAAVVGGNVLTSQRVTDVIFRCFEVCAASQGDCNNLTFGFGGAKDAKGGKQQGFGYYETIAGGAGAGPSWDGASGVHVHMTNTRMTDTEVFERRYPVIVHEFGLRSGSGGAGQHKGGEGVIRDIEFRMPLQVSILSERRVHRPYGMKGGLEGACGQNIWLRSVTNDKTNEEVKHRLSVNLGGKNTAAMKSGDRIQILTPGGGGWGEPGAARSIKRSADHQHAWRKGSIAERTGTAESSS